MSQHKPIIVALSFIADTLLAFLFVLISPDITNFIAEFTEWEPQEGFSIFSLTPMLAGAAIMAVPIVLRITGFYRRNNLQRTSTAIRQLFTFAVYYLCAIAIYQSLRSGSSLFQNHVLLVNVIGIPIILFLRFAIFRWLQLHTFLGHGMRRQVILIGSPQDIEQGWNNLPGFWKPSFNVVGRFSPGVNTEEELQTCIETNHVEQVFLFGGMRAYADCNTFTTISELQGIDVYVLLKNDHSANLRAEITEIDESRILVFTSTPVYSISRLVKGVMARFLALIALIGTSPIWLITAIGIKISDPNGKVFYRQARSGLYGKPFMMWKFRSMYSDADKRLDEVKAKYGNEMDGPIFKLTNDPRIFPFGHFIRKFSIDELPQLLNILAGDMSIVGPRPLPVYETEELPKIQHRRRLSVKPGLTCFWQVEGRSDSADFDEMIAKDLRYIDNWSLWLDFVLILRTVPAVLLGRGAK